MATQHSHGPLAVIRSASGKPLIVADYPRRESGDIAKLPDTPEGWANAHLFAAADQMLQALQLVAQQHENGWQVPCIASVLAAIERANGR